MNKNEIMELLPHRNSMLLVDEAELKDGMAFGKKKINGDEWFLDGHFPGHPIVPGNPVRNHGAVNLRASQRQNGTGNAALLYRP